MVVERGQLAGRAGQHDRLGTDEGLDLRAKAELADRGCNGFLAARTGSSNLVPVDALDGSLPAVGLADETGDKGGPRIVIEVLGRAHLLEPATVHHRDLIRHDQGFRLIVGDVDEGGAEV